MFRPFVHHGVLLHMQYISSTHGRKVGSDAQANGDYFVGVAV
jgi:hypothetical protein